MFDVDGQTVAVLVPGDREVSQKKLAGCISRRWCGPSTRTTSSGWATPRATWVPTGSVTMSWSSPIHSVRGGANWVTGANRRDMHVTVVTDGSFMVSSGCQNPSLTYMAFTARAANHAVEELKKGNL